jgi:hypothetical protein
MVKRMSKQTRAKAAAETKPRQQPEVLDEEERILREATKHLVFQHGMFLVATGIRAARIKGLRVWIITVTLRYTTGHEGYIGDLLYDGQDFTFLTEQSVMDERARKIADDPERMRKWNEYRGSTLPAGRGIRFAMPSSTTSSQRHSIRDAIIHNVIPTQLTARSVAFHDPGSSPVHGACRAAV